MADYNERSLNVNYQQARCPRLTRKRIGIGDLVHLLWDMSAFGQRPGEL
jgi:hypothetical protein